MSSARELIRKYGQPGAVLDVRETEEVHKLAEITRDLLQWRWRRFIESRRDAALLVQYSADATPLTTWERYGSAVPLWKVLRRAKTSKHFLVERAFALDSKGECTVLFDAPRDLVDQTQWSHFAAARMLTRSPRELGHEGLLLLHHVFDRGIESSLSRRLHQLQIALEQHQGAEKTDGEFFKTWAATWFLSVGCCLHDVHNAFKWSIRTFIDDPATTKSLWITLESARASYDLLARFLGEWLSTVIAFEDAESTDTRQLWEVMV